MIGKFLIAAPRVRSSAGRRTIGLRRSRRLIPPRWSRSSRVRRAIRVLLVIVALRIRHKVSMGIHTRVRYRCHLAHPSPSMPDASFRAKPCIILQIDMRIHRTEKNSHVPSISLRLDDRRIIIDYKNSFSGYANRKVAVTFPTRVRDRLSTQKRVTDYAVFKLPVMQSQSAVGHAYVRIVFCACI